jgi:hypothetical protein
MSNKRITDLTELTNPTTDDVFPVVDIASNTTTKVQLGNLPVPSSVTTALATKQDSLVSGTNIKTINSTSVLGSGNIAVQETLVSGTNIKTLNNTSLLGSGNITLTANPSGVSGAIQFSNGSAFASDAANLFWDDTNNRLGVRTNAPSFPVDVVGEIRSSNIVSVGSLGTNGNFSVRRSVDGAVAGTLVVDANEVVLTEKVGSGGRLDTGFGTTALKWLGSSSQPRIGIGFNGSILATTHIKGSGSTSATTSLLVQNSSASELLRVRDDGRVYIGTTGYFLPDFQSTAMYNFYNKAVLTSSEISNIVKVLLANNTHSFCGAFGGVNGQVGINTNTPNATAALEVVSTTTGFLPPRMTTTQKNAIASPATGLVVYDSTTNKLQCYNGSTWNDLF